MSPDLLLFAVGSLLLVTGVLGGGFEMRELRVPRVGRFARVLATGAGALCILLGLGLSGVAPAPVEADDQGPVQFRIHDSLAENQISEQATVVFDGRRVGDLTVSQDYPETELEVSVDAPGRHDYTVAVSSVEQAEDGSVVERNGSGQGSVVVQQGSVLQLGFAESRDGRDVTLVAE